ncbi:MAG: hypothetical protein WCD70_15975 [Alphaproteobacteria bacterium]
MARAASYDVDDVTLAAIAEMKKAFGVRTNSQVIRKALALARVAAQESHLEDGQRIFKIVQPGTGKLLNVLLNG